MKHKKSLKNLNPHRVWMPAGLALSVVVGATLVGATTACSNTINIKPNFTGSSGPKSNSNLNAQFRALSNVSIPANAEVVGISFSDKNKPVILLDNGTSAALDLGVESPSPNTLNPPNDLSLADAKFFPVTETDCWAVSQKEIKLRYQKDASSTSISGASVNFASEPQVVSANSRAILLKIGSAYKLIKASGKLEIIYDAPLDFAGKTAPMTNIAGTGLIGDSGFWVTDGERRVSIIVKAANQAPIVIAERITVSGQGTGSMIAFNVVDANSTPSLLGSAVAYRKSDRAFLRTDDLGDGGAGGSTGAEPGVIADAEVLKLVNASCVGCHGAGATNEFKDATKEASWKASAASLKEKLEANSMPPGGGQMALRQTLAAYITKVSGVVVNIPSATPTPTPTPTGTPDPKLAEFNATYKTLIQNSCVNACHTHTFQLGNEATYERVRAAKVGMKARLDNNSMPRAPVTITAAQRTMLSTWLDSLP
ncbi:MAG: hypothetical protein RI953_662 [Pseudomonadota bacterium]|jgi:mono/diheme cytochrome c family protein